MSTSSPKLPTSFIGEWQLDPAQSKYAFGQLPINARYIITAHDQQRFQFTIKWTTANGQKKVQATTGLVNGRERPVYRSKQVDTTCYTLVNNHVLTLTAKRLGKIVTRVRYRLSKDERVLTITQSGTSHTGEAFVNRAVYRRL